MSTWDDLAFAYSRSFGTLCAGTIDRLLADTGPGTLLDVGCGTGVLGARAEAARRVVTAVDAEESMVDLARRRIRGRVLQASLPDLPFRTDEFDAVIANFVVNHVDLPCASVHELARVARRGGDVALTIWPPPTSVRRGWGEFMGAVFAAAEVEPIPNRGLDPSLDFERSAAGLSELAERSGLGIRTALDLEWEWSIAPEDLWAGIEGGVAGVGATYLAQPLPTRRRVRQIFDERCAQVIDDSGRVIFTASAAYVLASKP